MKVTRQQWESNTCFMKVAKTLWHEYLKFKGIFLKLPIRPIETLRISFLWNRLHKKKRTEIQRQYQNITSSQPKTTFTLPGINKQLMFIQSKIPPNNTRCPAIVSNFPPKVNMQVTVCVCVWEKLHEYTIKPSSMESWGQPAWVLSDVSLFSCVSFTFKSFSWLESSSVSFPSEFLSFWPCSLPSFVSWSSFFSTSASPSEWIKKKKNKCF